MATINIVSEHATKLFNHITRKYKPEVNRQFEVSFNKKELESFKMKGTEIIQSIEELKKGGYINWTAKKHNIATVTLLKRIPLRPRA